MNSSNKYLAYLALLQARAVLFDWDGTLVNSADFVPDIHSEILTQLSIPLDAVVIKQNLGISQTALLEMALRNNNKSVEPDIINSFIPDFVRLEDEIFDDYYADGRIHLKTGAYNLLASLKQHQKPIGIVSNAYDDVTHKRLINTKLMGLFLSQDDVFGRTRIGTTKPNPQQIIVACQTLGCTPQEAIFFGDTQSDRGACHAAGIPMIQIGRGELVPPSDIILEDFSGLALPSMSRSVGFPPPRP